MKIALIGNQNSGKTTLFNSLTGSNQKIGNWPGVTIERKEGKIKNTEHTLVDLPGIYSLSPYTLEEEVSRNFLFEEKPSLIINIIDATNIERSLYLTTQLLELDCEVLLVLNMEDMLKKKGITISLPQLKKALGVDAVSISALKNVGIKELLAKIKNYQPTKKSIKIYESPIESAIDNLKLDSANNRFIKIKLLENDIKFSSYINENIVAIRKTLECQYKMDIEQIIANQRYNFIEKIKVDCFNKITVKESITDKLDRIFLNKWAGIPIFALIMVGIYVLSVGVVGSFTVDMIGGAVESFSSFVESKLLGLGASGWIISLVCKGIISGVGAVFNFIPQLIILFLCISLLETTGYMSRIAFLLDKVFRKFGLSGKSLIPFIIGTGCSVPAIMACRTIEDMDEREVSITLTPFVPCSAKLPIITLFAGYFFGEYGGFISASLYLFAIVIIVFSAYLLKKFSKKSTATSFISELPEYKLPSLKYVAKDVFDKTFAFIKRAGTIILFCSIVIWFLMSFSWRFEYGVAVEKSILASIGNALAWFFYPIIGEWSWAMSVSAIQGLIAKEQVISSMSIIAGFGEIASGNMIFGSSLFSFLTPAGAYAYMVFNLFSAPCIGAIGAMRRELGSTKKMVKSILFQTGLAWLLAVITFQILMLF